MHRKVSSNNNMYDAMIFSSVAMIFSSVATTFSTMCVVRATRGSSYVPLLFALFLILLNAFPPYTNKKIF